MRSLLALFTVAVCTWAPCMAQGSRSARQDPDVMNYRLSMDKLRKLPDVQRALNAAHRKNPQVFENIDQETHALSRKNGSPSVAQRAAILERHPEARRVFTSAGWSARDWMLTSEAMGDAFMAIEARRGAVAAPPTRTAAQKANVALLEKNQAEFRKILEELDELTDELINQ